MQWQVLQAPHDWDRYASEREAAGHSAAAVSAGAPRAYPCLIACCATGTGRRFKLLWAHVYPADVQLLVGACGQLPASTALVPALASASSLPALLAGELTDQHELELDVLAHQLTTFDIQKRTGLFKTPAQYVEIFSYFRALAHTIKRLDVPQLFALQEQRERQVQQEP